MDVVILLLSVLSLVALGFLLRYAHQDLEQSEQIKKHLHDLEIASEGYSGGKLNGAYSRMLKRQEKNYER